MFLKRMGPFRSKLRSFDAEQGFYGATFEDFQLDSEQVVSGFLDESSFPRPSPEIRPGPNATPERSSQGECDLELEESSSMDHDDDDDDDDDEEEEEGKTVYNSCIDTFSIPASPFHLPSKGELELDHDHDQKQMQTQTITDDQKVKNSRVRLTDQKDSRSTSKQVKGTVFFAVTAKLKTPCGVGPDAVADGNIIRRTKPPSRSLDIGRPTNVIHGNVDPQDLALQLKGCKMPKWMQGSQWTKDRRGKCAPAVPNMMFESLVLKGGLGEEGIFRVNADAREDERVRKELDRGKFPADADVHCLAGLIKAWFREHPKGIFAALTPEKVTRCDTEEDCLEVVSLLPPLESRLLDWALNMMADVVDQQEHNKMNARNIATVFAPNMTRMEDPLMAVKHVVQVIHLLKTLVNITVRERSQSSASLVDMKVT